MVNDIETGGDESLEPKDSVASGNQNPHESEDSNRKQRHRDAESSLRRLASAKVVTGCQEPMNPRDRWLQGVIGKSEDIEGIDSGIPRQYRIKSSGISTAGYKNRAMGVEYDPSDWMNRFLVWSFRTSFVNLFLVLSAAFFFFTAVWALLIFWVGVAKPHCVISGGLNFDEAGNDFNDAFQLSWTTFSTVGYGLVYPSVGNKGLCVGIGFLTALESFIGVLFAGIAGALVFGKIARAQSYAKVAFSDPIVIRYGTGLFHLSDDVSEASQSQQMDLQSTNKPIPCPILEFRVVNLLHNQRGGEILNATINVVASTRESCAAPSIRNAARKGARALTYDSIKAVKHGLTLATGLIGEGTSLVKKMAPSILHRANHPKSIPEDSTVENSEQDDSEADHQAFDELGCTATLANSGVRDHIIVDEGSSAPRQIFSKLQVETECHPFFKRVWFIRHTVNEDSPLLHPNAAKLVRENNGFWPAELNNHSSVRQNVNFDQLIVNLSGTSNVSGASVYSQKVYDYVDANVGFRFAEMMKLDEGQRIILDPELLNDVHVQWGGGAEPLTDVVEGDTDILESALGCATQAFQTGADFSKKATEKVGRAAATGAQFAADIVQNKAP